MWKIDFIRLATQLLPPVLRGAVLLALLRVLVVPLRGLYDRFTAGRETTAARLDTTANVQYIEKALCDAFFLHDGQIYIETPVERPAPALYFKSEGRPPACLHEAGGTPYYVNAPGEAFHDAAFIVRVPTFLCTDFDPERDEYGGRHLAAIRTILNVYKPAGRTYRIELYDYE